MKPTHLLLGCAALLVVAPLAIRIATRRDAPERSTVHGRAQHVAEPAFAEGPLDAQIRNPAALGAEALVQAVPSGVAAAMPAGRRKAWWSRSEASWGDAEPAVGNPS